MKENEHFRCRPQEEVAKIVQCGEPFFVFVSAFMSGIDVSPASIAAFVFCLKAPPENLASELLYVFALDVAKSG